MVGLKSAHATVKSFFKESICAVGLVTSAGSAKSSDVELQGKLLEFFCVGDLFEGELLFPVLGFVVTEERDQHEWKAIFGFLKDLKDLHPCGVSVDVLGIYELRVMCGDLWEEVQKVCGHRMMIDVEGRVLGDFLYLCGICGSMV